MPVPKKQTSLEEDFLANARERLQRVRAGGGLNEFIPHVTPGYTPPRHLAPLVDELERAVNGQRVRVVCHAPPRHGKTESVLHCIGWGLRRKPRLVFGYATYGADLSYSKS